ncbi:MAG: methyltransferase domain-containing protein [Candidatus Moranbacteria bacterium]|nr:methyltransferase domain-containing protein [Candidatus Moranbacteria bacterium]MDD3964530.1 methyltransferase domain-containing protein [Candidatus Moranbacteria bacterium]
MNAPLAMTFTDPTSIVNALDIQEGDIVADFGCGAGFFSLEFAKRVGSEGKVYAFDILPSSLEAVTSGAKTMNLINVTPKRANLEKENGSGLSPESIDWVLLKDILLQNEKKDIILKEASRILKKGGHMLVMEWNAEDTLVGPDAGIRISPEDLTTLVTAIGLTVEKELPVGGYHYAFVIKK